MNYYTEQQELNKFKKQIKNVFLSTVRNFNNFDNFTNEDIVKADELAKEIHENFDKVDNKDILFYTMSYLNRLSYINENKDFLVLTLIRTIDPKLELYKIYEEESRKKEIRQRSLIEIGFYDPELIKFEKAYINKFCNKDNFDFTKKYVF